MDKYEYKLKLEQLKALVDVRDYKMAAEIASGINWRKVKSVATLCMVGEIFEKTQQYELSREVLLMAYDRSPVGRNIISRLTLIALKMGNLEEAQEYYEEFIDIAPHDNLKYVLRYEIARAKGQKTEELISILEEFKEREYTEEWAFELAYLYHRNGKPEKCVEICDELILWFGEGDYVEKALELKMIYQPLNRLQEDKYRRFRLRDDGGVTEVSPKDIKTSGAMLSGTVRIPSIHADTGLSNTVNLQAELMKGMQQIMEATKPETVTDVMDNIRKMVEDTPELCLPEEEIEPEAEPGEITKRYGPIGALDDGDDEEEEVIVPEPSLAIDFRTMLSEERDGQISLNVPDAPGMDKQITGQMSLEDILTEWEKTKEATKSAIAEAEQRKLQQAKARALQQAESLMERLQEVVTEALLEAQQENLEAQQAGQPEISYLEAEMTSQPEFSHVEAELAEQSGPSHAEAEQASQPGFSHVEAELAERSESSHAEIAPQPEYKRGAETVLVPGMTQPLVIPEIGQEMWALPEPPKPERATHDVLELGQSLDTEGSDAQEAQQWEISHMEAEMTLQPEVSHMEGEAEPKRGAETVLVPGMTQPLVIPEIGQRLRLDPEPDEMPSDMPGEGLTLIWDKMESPEKKAPGLTRLTEELRQIFTYFTLIGGMEEQLCQALQGVWDDKGDGVTSRTGNLVILGGHGSGKTVLATDFIKAFQQFSGQSGNKVGKISAMLLNQKDIGKLFQAVEGGYLIIEQAGSLSRESVNLMARLMQRDTDGLLVILEDDRAGIERAMSHSKAFAGMFTQCIQIPIFTSDELVVFARSYAREHNCEIDDMGILALYNSISNIQKLDEATTLTEIKEIMDEAIDHANRGGIKKLFGGKRVTEDGFILIKEKDFE